MVVDIASKNLMKQRKHHNMGYMQSLRWPMFHLEVTDIQNSHKIDTMGIWKIFYGVTLNPSRYFYSLSNGTCYD